MKYLHGLRDSASLLRRAVIWAVLIAAYVLGCSPVRSQTPVAVEYGQGFFNPEQNEKEKWRWMSEEGVVRLPNTDKGMLLTLAGRTPIGAFKEQPTISIVFNGKILEQFDAPPGMFQKEYAITVAQQGTDEWSELRVQTSKTAAPKDFLKNATDARQLGFKLYDLTWKSESGELPVPVADKRAAVRRLVWIISALSILGIIVLLAMIAAWRSRRKSSAGAMPE